MMLAQIAQLAAPKVWMGVGILVALLVGAWGAQTVRLAWAHTEVEAVRGKLGEALVTLDTVRGDRDQAARTANENAAAVVAVNNRLAQCVASKAADVEAARREAAAALQESAANTQRLQREINNLRDVYDRDAESGVWADDIVPGAVADSLRDAP